MVAQPAGIVGIFVPGNNLINTLPQQPQRFGAHAVIPARVVRFSLLKSHPQLHRSCPERSGL